MIDIVIYETDPGERYRVEAWDADDKAWSEWDSDDYSAAEDAVEAAKNAKKAVPSGRFRVVAISQEQLNKATLPEPTERQSHALTEFLEHAQAHGLDIREHSIEISYRPETRPGRGHDLVAFASDGERMATAYIDVYGNGEGPSIHDINLACFPAHGPTCSLPQCSEGQESEQDAQV